MCRSDEQDMTVQMVPQSSDISAYDGGYHENQRFDHRRYSDFFSDAEATVLDQETAKAYCSFGENETETVLNDIQSISVQLPPYHREDHVDVSSLKAFSPEAKRLLLALPDLDQNPITVDEVLEAILFIRKNRLSRNTDRPVKQAACDSSMTMMDNLTQMHRRSACLRLADGERGMLPVVIPVDIPRGEIFTIGRFDVSVGRKQSDFEFDKKTKAVSRRHAMIERKMDGSYVILDCGSKAGTYVNGEQLLPKTPYRIECGTRISFGTAGANYIWEE